LLPDVLVDGEIVALDHRRTEFSTLQAAISDGKPDNLIFSRSIVCSQDGMDIPRSAWRGEAAIKAVAGLPRQG